MTDDLFLIERISENPRSNIKWKPGQRELINKLYNEKTSIRELGKMFGGLHYNTIKRILDEFNTPLRTRSESCIKDNRDSNIFNIIDTEEKAYWLGFIAADGCVYKNYLRVALQLKDKEHLQKLQKFIGATDLKIQTTDKFCAFAIGNIKIYNDLIKHGVVENKSLILQPPKTVPKEFELDWIRGYWDGDGGISYSSKSNRWQAYCTSTKDVLNWIRERINLNLTPFLEHRCKNTYRIHFNGRINVLNKMNLLYRDGKAKVYLERKWILYQKLCSTQTR